MKKKLFIVILASTILLSACSSGQQAETTSSIEETTTTAVTTTEATTTTTEATTTTSQVPIVGDKPEDYADVNCFEGTRDTEKIIATDFDFVDASLDKDENNVHFYPNYPAGKNIVVRFKCDKEFKVGSIFRFPSSKQYDEDYLVNNVKNSFGNIAGFSSPNGKKTTSNISKFLSYKDGVYTLTIPAKYAKTDNQFYIQLYKNVTNEPVDFDDELYNLIFGAGISFYLRCEKETKNPTFTPKQHAGLYGLIDDKLFTDFVFVDAEYPVSNDGHRYKPEIPRVKTNQDIVITFKCKENLELNDIYLTKPGSDIGDEENIATSCVFKQENGVYTITIPAEYARSGNSFMCSLSIKGNEERSSVFWFECQST